MTCNEKEEYLKNLLRSTLLDNQELDAFKTRMDQLRWKNQGILQLVLFAQLQQGKLEHVCVVLDALDVPTVGLSLQERLALFQLTG